MEYALGNSSKMPTRRLDKDQKKALKIWSLVKEELDRRAGLSIKHLVDLTILQEIDLKIVTKIREELNKD